MLLLQRVYSSPYRATYYSIALLWWLLNSNFIQPQLKSSNVSPTQSLVIIWGDFSFKVIMAQNCAAGASYSQTAGVGVVFNAA